MEYPAVKERDEVGLKGRTVVDLQMWERLMTSMMNGMDDRKRKRLEEEEVTK